MVHSSLLCISTSSSDLLPFSMHAGGESKGHSVGTRTHKCVMAPEHGLAAGGETMASPTSRCTVIAGQCNPALPCDRPVAVGLATGQECLESLGLPPAGVCTIQGTTSPSSTAFHVGRRSCVWREGLSPHTRTHNTSHTFNSNIGRYQCGRINR